MTDGTTIVFDCPLPPWLVGAAAGIVLAAVIVLTRRDAARLSRLRRRVILCLAVLAGVMLTGLLLCPKFIRAWQDPRKPVCSILVDGSQSMRLTDTYAGEMAEWLAKAIPAGNPEPTKATREQIVTVLLANTPDGWLAALAEGFDLSGWRFAATAEALPLGRADASFTLDPEGYATAIGEALDRISRGVGGARPRAIVLISDGAWNTGRDPSEVARVLGRLGTPVFVVGMGDPEPPRDAAVMSLRAPKSHLLGDELLLTAQVASTGMGAARLKVRLIADGEDLDAKEVVTLPSGRPMNVTFSTVPTEPGRRFFTVRIGQQQGEQDASNNSASAWVNVIERKIRVLLIDGEPRWEFRFIRNVFERDPAVALTVCLLRPGVGSIAGEGYLQKVPTDKKDLAAYDLLILGDVERGKLPDAFLEPLAEMVRHRGAGLVVVAGRRGHYRQLAGTPVAELLPVSLEGAVQAPLRGMRPFQAELTQEGASHLMTRLVGGADEVENEASWSRLPPLHWSAAVGGLARGAMALLVHPYRLAGASKLPLLAVHRVGSGKVLFCGTDETWRWRRSVGDKYHYRFWAQVVRWMVKKQFTEGDPRGRLSIDRDECATGETVQIEAFCLGPDGFPLQGAQVRLKIERAGGEVQQLAMQPAPGGWGIYRASFTASRPGKYLMRPIVSIYGDQPLSSSVSLEVSRADLEKNFLAQDRNTLTAIAEASGGQYLDATQVDRLPSLLAAKIEKRLLTAEYSPCQHWAYYTLLAALLAAAWLIRKRSGLA